MSNLLNFTVPALNQAVSSNKADATQDSISRGGALPGEPRQCSL